jgi:ribosomal protein RSM22 (predicted rRNA methylase)
LDAMDARKTGNIQIKTGVGNMCHYSHRLAYSTLTCTQKKHCHFANLMDETSQCKVRKKTRQTTFYWNILVQTHKKHAAADGNTSTRKTYPHISIGYGHGNGKPTRETTLVSDKLDEDIVAVVQRSAGKQHRTTSKIVPGWSKRFAGVLGKL